MPSTRRLAKRVDIVLNFDGTEVVNDHSALVDVPELQNGGRIVRADFELDLAGSATSIDFNLYNGPYDTTSTATDISARHIAYQESAIALTAGAVTHVNLRGVSAEAVYYKRPRYNGMPNRNAMVADDKTVERILADIKLLAGTGASTVTVTLYVEDIH